MSTIKLQKYAPAIMMSDIDAVNHDITEVMKDNDSFTLDFEGIKGIEMEAAEAILSSLRAKFGPGYRKKVQLVNVAPIVNNAFTFSGSVGVPDSAPVSSSHATRRRRFSAAFSHIFASLLLLLTLGVGQMWAWNNVYYQGDNTSWNNVDMGNSGNASIYMYIANGQYWRYRIENCDCGPDSNTDMGIGSGDSKWYRYDNCASRACGHYTGNSGIVLFHAKQIDNGDRSPWVWLERPTVVIKHEFTPGGSWEQNNMTDNNNGTYKYTGNYGGTGANVGPSSWLKYIESPTLVGSPSSGDRCIFEYNASGYQGSGNEDVNTGSLTITKLYTITYDGNGNTSGSVPSDQTDIKYNTATNVRNNSGTLTKTNYTFDGWNTKDDGSGTNYIAGSGSISPTGSSATITLYARWKQSGTVNANGGSADRDYLVYWNGALISPTATAPTRTGYTLNGFYKEAGCSNMIAGASGYLQASTTYTNSSKQWNYTGSFPTLYAGWTAKTYTTANNIKNSDNSNAGQYTATYDATSIALNTTPTKSGYHIVGYYKEKTFTNKIANADLTLCASTDYTDASSHWIQTSNVTLYVKWEEDVGATMTVNATSGGTITTPATGYYTNISATSYSITASRSEGYVFTGWTQSGSGAVTFGSASSLTTTATVTTVNDVTVTANFEAMSNSLSVSSSTLYAGDNITLTATRTNHTLDLTYQYKIGTGEWIDIATQSGTTKTWQIPYANTYQTYNFRVKSTDGSTNFYSAGQPVTVKGRIVIHVKNTNSWTSMYLYSWYNNGSDQKTNGNWPGTTGSGSNGQSCSIHATGSQWWDVTITQTTSTAQKFILNCNTSGDQNQTGDLNLSDFTHDAYYAMSTNGSTNQTLSTTTTPAAPTLSTSSAGTIRENSAVLGGNVSNLGNDIISERGYYWSTNSALSSSNLGVGTKVTVDGTQSSTGTFSNTKSSLSAGTKYYFIAYAKNGYGTSYGAVNNFTTLNTYIVTVATENASKGIVSPSSVTVGQYKNATITATPYAGYRFDNWSKSTNNITIANSSNASTTVTATSAGTVTANFARSYAFVEGRFHVTNESRNGTWINSFTAGNWGSTCTNIPFEYDGTNHRFYLHTYATPKELKTQISGNDPYFYVTTSSASGSVTNAVNFHPTSNMDLTAAGTENKKAAQTASETYNYKFNSNDESGYVVLYFDEAGVWYELEQTLSYDANGGTGDAPAITYHLKGTSATAAANPFTKTGYNFAGWKTAPSSGTSYAAGASVTMNSNITLYAQWTAKTYTITLDKQTSAAGYGSAGSASNPTATYDAVLPTISGTMPSATGAYGFKGFYTEPLGEGLRLTDASGVWIASVEGYTDADKKWIHDGDVTLYAYYKQAEIADITFTGGDAVSPNASVTVTAVLDPAPAGTCVICWRVLYNNDNEISPQPTFSPAAKGATVSFIAPEAPATYKVEAKLQQGSECGGTLIDTKVVTFHVAGDHSVRVHYKCGNEEIRPSETITARPLVWSSDITAPEIVGYSFSKWVGLDGVSIKDCANDTSTNATIQIKAIYDGNLTAYYTRKGMIYFKNTLGWENVYVNLYSSSYWDDPHGSGNQSLTNRNLEMTQLGETDIWYYDYETAGITPSLYVSFTDQVQNGSGSGSQYFWGSGDGVNVIYPANYPDAINTDKSAENGFKAATPMFVPLAGQDAVVLNSANNGKANYFNAGYWTKYTAGTGYTLEVYSSDGSLLLKSLAFTSEDELMPMKAVADLDGGSTFKFQVRRGGESSAGFYYGNSGTMNYANHGQGTAWEMINTMTPDFSMAQITTNASGEYVFNLSYAANASNQYRLRMEVDYPVATGDYRIIYKDNTHNWWHPSAVITKVNNAKDTVSFFIRPGQTPVMKIQTATVDAGGAITWGDYSTISGKVDNAGTDALPRDSVYNICLQMDGSGAISVENVEPYTGNFYIRTDAANSKWDNYRSDPDHLMTYSEYSITHGGYSHYYCHWVQANQTGRKNVKFVIANDYSPCISDTLIREPAEELWSVITNYISEGGDMLRDANVRFMWNQHTNAISRAYVDGAQGNYSANFLYMRNVEGNGTDKIKNSDGSALNDHKVLFEDKENWIYEANVKALPQAQIKLISNLGTTNALVQYFWGAPNSTETLIAGSGNTWYDIRVIYDFKTNRLIGAWVPSDSTINGANPINSDLMFIREHQGDVAQLTFGASGDINSINTAYGVLQFNKWTLNNKDKSTHSPLAAPTSIYERSLYWISFPFRVKLSEVFGFGTYGKHWAVQRYAGDERAAKGHFLENGSFWRWMDSNTEYLEPNQGYLLAIDLDLLDISSTVWGPESRSERIELYFPSYGTMPNITNTNVVQTIPSHECTINWAASKGLPDTDDPRTSYNRTVFDSHWNVLSVPTYVNTSSVTFGDVPFDGGSTTWQVKKGPKFLYSWNSDDNTISAITASDHQYHAMHAYMAQYAGTITWSASSGTVSSIVARRTYADEPQDVEFRLELQQNEKMIDRTYVVLSNDEETSTGFRFGEDMTKEFNANKANIFTIIPDEASVAGNTLPMSDETTIVPVGVEIKTDCEYTFTMPDGTNGVGVILVDNETGIRTQLGLTSYIVTLAAGDYTNRFTLEISPILKTPTGLEPVTDDGSQATGARKVMIDGLLYIIKEGKVFDAQGARIQ